ncbi:MbcA/ParS/Xre antitoxin family protein [Marinobacter orientalis]|uniref:MbcA/ParS/Xre antitoxin family protein n=1 Tax=Marinobacter orientalis TaxID=1928859 RepID=UPI0010939A7F|nr:DUF2384 domain-containing protein [Marinobacter orientalis]
MRSLTKQLVWRAFCEGTEDVIQARKWVAGMTDVSKEEVVAELRERVYRDVLELFEGDKANANRWLSSPIRVLGNHSPVSLMETKTGLEKIRRLIKKWEQGAVS